MRRLAVLIAALAVLLAGCGGHRATPHVWVTPGHAHTLTACASSDCGPYSATLNWSGFQVAGTASYAITCTVSGTACPGSPYSTTGTSYTLPGMDCGTTYSISVQAHNSGGSGIGPVVSTTYTTPTCPTSSPFPLKVSSNSRYLETAGGSPFLMAGDSPQSLMGEVSTTNAATYFADREAHGFNTVYINLLCDSYTFCTGCDGSVNCGALTANYGETYDAILPFTATLGGGTYNLLDPNASYFSRATTMVSQAEADGLEVVLDPIETGGWEATLVANGNGTVSTSDSDYQYGQFVGNTFKAYPNVLWLMGNDFQDYATNTAANNDLLSVLNGIANTDPSALSSIELNFICPGSPAGQTQASGSPSDTAFASALSVNQAYTYSPTYGQNLANYNSTPTKPSFLGEANYEFEANCSYDGGTSRVLRLQEWWTMTSGATGQLYGSKATDRIANATFPLAGSNPAVDSTGVTQFDYETSLLSGLEWYNLVPDQTSSFLTSTSPTNSCLTTGDFATVNCVTAALATDGKLGLLYFPDPGGTLSTATVNLGAMTAPSGVTARWYDPTNGQFTSIPGSPFAASGTHNFTPTGTNSSGTDSDWVLLLQG